MQMKIAKADGEDLKTTIDFLNACDAIWDNRFSMRPPENEWEEWDDDDEEKAFILKLRKDLAADEGIKESDVDNRALMYEYLRHRFLNCSTKWRRVVWAADVLIDTFCDPTEDVLASLPGIELFHVAPEQ